MDHFCRHRCEKLTLWRFLNTTEPVAGKRTCLSCGKKIRATFPFLLLHTLVSVLWGITSFILVPRTIYLSSVSPFGGLLAFLIFTAATLVWLLAGAFTVNHAAYAECKKQ